MSKAFNRRVRKGRGEEQANQRFWSFADFFPSFTSYRPWLLPGCSAGKYCRIGGIVSLVIRIKRRKPILIINLKNRGIVADRERQKIHERTGSATGGTLGAALSYGLQFQGNLPAVRMEQLAPIGGGSRAIADVARFQALAAEADVQRHGSLRDKIWHSVSVHRRDAHHQLLAGGVVGGFKRQHRREIRLPSGRNGRVRQAPGGELL